MDKIKIGDFVTAYRSGYWQLVSVKPKIATEDYTDGDISWKKGQLIGMWAILKKCFTAKMKPRIEFSYEDLNWIKPVDDDVLGDINKYFKDHPEYKEKLDNAEIRLEPMITNCWLDLPKDKESDFKATLQNLPARYTEDEFWLIAKEYKKYLSNPPARYLLNLFTYPWDVDKDINQVYSNWALVKNAI